MERNIYIYIYIYYTDRFQRFATRMVKGLFHLPYIQRLQRLNYAPLKNEVGGWIQFSPLEFSTADMIFRGIYSSLYRLILTSVVTT